MLPALTALFVSVSVVALPVAAQERESPPEITAPDREAREAFVSGSAAFEAGRFEQALRDFQRSYALSGRAALLYNIGLAHDRLRHDREAFEAFQAFLDADPTTVHRPRVEARLRSLREAIAAEDAQRYDATRERAALESELARAEARQSPSVFERWWFWTLAGVLVAGVVVGVLVLTAEDEVQRPIPGTLGSVHMVLRAP
jgi:tetratricopeptide (TPR) repeat protein